MNLLLLNQVVPVPVMCVCACVRACVRACVCACMHAVFGAHGAVQCTCIYMCTYVWV